MRTRAEIDRELARESRAITSLREHAKRATDDSRRRRANANRRAAAYRWRDPADRERRDARIMELWAMGRSRREIAADVDLSPARISQIVNSYGAGWRPNRYRSAS